MLKHRVFGHPGIQYGWVSPGYKVKESRRRRKQPRASRWSRMWRMWKDVHGEGTTMFRVYEKETSEVQWNEERGILR